MNEESVISEELESLLNVEFGPDVYEIEKGMVRRFADAIGDDNPTWNELTPPTFPAALVPTSLIHRLFNAKFICTPLFSGTVYGRLLSRYPVLFDIWQEIPRCCPGTTGESVSF